MRFSSSQGSIMIEKFIQRQVLDKGLDPRTAKAYRLDLTHLYDWMEKQGISEFQENEVKRYLQHLVSEKGLRHSTVTRKSRVFGYYLQFCGRDGTEGGATAAGKGAAAEGAVKGVGSGSFAAGRAFAEIAASVETAAPSAGKSTIAEMFSAPSASEKEARGELYLSAQETDAFFAALDREYASLDSEFRKRVCLRDDVMMELLFYHGIEISELLALQVGDYERKNGILHVHRKRMQDKDIYLFSDGLREKMERWLEARQYFEKDNEFHQRLFLSKLGKPLSMKMVINVFDKYRELAGIERECTPKDLKGSLERYAMEKMVGEWR